MIATTYTVQILERDLWQDIERFLKAGDALLLAQGTANKTGKLCRLVPMVDHPKIVSLILPPPPKEEKA